MEVREKMLPVLGPKGGEEEVQALREVIESGWWGKGPKVSEFEEKFAEMVGHKYAVAVTSNSHGQDLVMKAMGFNGVDVINPAISFIATAMVPLWNNCTSNIVDVKRDTLCIDPDDVERYKKSNSEVLIAVDEAGVFADYENLRKKFGGFILQDCAHSCWTPGAGLDGDVAVWSFQAVKTMPAGDGGMITTNDKLLAERFDDLKNPPAVNRPEERDGFNEISMKFHIKFHPVVKFPSPTASRQLDHAPRISFLKVRIFK